MFLRTVLRSFLASLALSLAATASLLFGFLGFVFHLLSLLFSLYDASLQSFFELQRLRIPTSC